MKLSELIQELEKIQKEIQEKTKNGEIDENRDPIVVCSVRLECLDFVPKGELGKIELILSEGWGISNPEDKILFIVE